MVTKARIQIATEEFLVDARRAKSEADLQMATASFLERLELVFTHPSPNVYRGLAFAVTKNFPSTRSFVERMIRIFAAKGKRSGVHAGVPDLLIFEAVYIRHEEESNALCTVRQFYRGLAIELKYGKGRPSPEQNEWKTRLEANGWIVELARTGEEIVAILDRCDLLNPGRSTS